MVKNSKIFKESETYVPIIMINIDEKDKKILEVLQEHADYSTRKIAKITLFPITTIHNRIRKLRELGVIKKYTIDVDHKKLGLNLAANILVLCDYKALKEKNKTQHNLSKEIKRMPEVEKVDIVTGETDMIIRVRVRDVEDLDRFLLEKLQKLTGIDKTRTLVILYED